MIVKPQVSDLLKHAENRFQLVVMTSKRVREINDGAKIYTDKKEDSIIATAADEIVEGKVKVVEK